MSRANIKHQGRKKSRKQFKLNNNHDFEFLIRIAGRFYLRKSRYVIATLLILATGIYVKSVFGRNMCDLFITIFQGGQSRDTHVVISHVLFNFFARFKVRFTIIFLVLGGFQKCHLVQSTHTKKLFLMALKF